MFKTIRNMFGTKGVRVSPVSKSSESKSYSLAGRSSFYGISSTTRVAADRALDYYYTIAPLFTSINSIANEVGSLALIVQDSSTGEAFPEHDLLTLLQHPNADCTQYEFFVQLASFYKLTGNVFVVADGPVNRPALELYTVNPACVTIMPGSDGFAKEMHIVSNGSATKIFKRKEVDGRFRYYNGDSEIWQIRSFNPSYGKGDLYGMSELNPIALELEQYFEASVHNLSLLKRGARPSGAVKVDNHLTDDQFQRLQYQLENFYSGSKNAGRAMILEGGDFVQMSQSNKDMDFQALKRDITNTIYNALRIPLPMISGEFASFSNMETSKFNFYDNAVLPTAKRLLEELTVFLMQRYQGSEGLVLDYDIDSLEALVPRKNQELLKLKESGVLTINELRTLLNYEPVDGGETIYLPTNLLPISEAGDVSIQVAEEEIRQAGKKE